MAGDNENGSTHNWLYSNQTNTTIRNCTVANYTAAIATFTGQYSSILDTTIYRTPNVTGTLATATMVAINGSDQAIYRSNFTINAGSASSQGTPYSLSLSGTRATLANNTFASYAPSPANCLLLNSLNSSTIAKNAIIGNNLTAAGLVNITLASGNNTFYWNNFTYTGAAAAGTYLIKDLNGTNRYNGTTWVGTNEGNIWPDVMNGTVAISGATISSGDFSALFIGTQGANYPYNNSSRAAALFSCSFSGCGDYRPLTPAFLAQCGALNTPNTIYNVSSCAINNSSAYTVAAANVTLDCQGNSLIGNNTTGTYGVYSAQPGTTVRNCIITGFQQAIYFAGATNGTIQNVTTDTNGSYSSPHYGASIYLYNGANGNRIIDSSILSRSGVGLLIAKSGSNIVNRTNITKTGGTVAEAALLSAASSGNTLDNVIANASRNGSAVSFNASDGNSLSSSRAYSNFTTAIRVTSASPNCRIINTSVYAANASAIYIDGGNNTAVDCLGGGMNGTNTTATYGIYSNQSGTAVRNCNIQNFSHAIYYYNITGGSINSTNASTTQASSYGLYVQISSLISIANSIAFSDADRAIYFLNSSSCNISNSTGNSTGSRGIQISYGYGIRIDDSYGYGRTGSGIGTYITDSSNDTVRNLTSIGNLYGLCFDGSATTSLNHRVDNSIGTANTSGGIVVIGTNLTINNSTGNSNSGYGIWIYQGVSNASKIDNCTANSTSNISLYIGSSSNNTITRVQALTGPSTNGTAFYVAPGVANTVIDCQGVPISGTNTTGTSGVYVANATNITLKNCNISNFQYGIFLSNASYSAIQNTSASTTHASGSGIAIVLGANNTVSSAYSLSAANYSLYLNGTANISVSNSTFSGKDDVYFAAASPLQCSQNFTNVSGSGSAPILFYNSSANLSGQNLSTIILCAANRSSITRVATIRGGIQAFYTYDSNFTNNTFSTTFSPAVYLAASTARNIFCLNNFTINSGAAYVQDLSAPTSTTAHMAAGTRATCGPRP